MLHKMKAWTPDTILELIQLYHSRPILWDHSHPEAKNIELKNAAWMEIAAIMNRADVEKKMSILIVQFRREMKKIHDINEKFRKGETTKMRSKWFAFEAMYFLKDKLRKHKRLNLPVPKDRSFQIKRQNRDRASSPNREYVQMTERLIIQNDQIANIETECDPPMLYTPKDEYSAFGELVAIKIRKLPTPSRKNRAMNVITNALFLLESESDVNESDLEYTESVILKDVESAETH